uniref:hypothetical protein n=1 Tax=Streptomyces phytophilus TaxID=722715 RepID=UPI0015F07B4B
MAGSRRRAHQPYQIRPVRNPVPRRHGTAVRATPVPIQFGSIPDGVFDVLDAIGVIPCAIPVHDSAPAAGF